MGQVDIGLVVGLALAIPCILLVILFLLLWTAQGGSFKDVVGMVWHWRSAKMIELASMHRGNNQVNPNRKIRRARKRENRDQHLSTQHHERYRLHMFGEFERSQGSRYGDEQVWRGRRLRHHGASGSNIVNGNSNGQYRRRSRSPATIHRPLFPEDLEMPNSPLGRTFSAKTRYHQTLPYHFGTATCLSNISYASSSHASGPSIDWTASSGHFERRLGGGGSIASDKSPLLPMPELDVPPAVKRFKSGKVGRPDEGGARTASEDAQRNVAAGDGHEKRTSALTTASSEWQTEYAGEEDR